MGPGPNISGDRRDLRRIIRKFDFWFYYVKNDIITGHPGKRLRRWAETNDSLLHASGQRTRGE